MFKVGDKVQVKLSGGGRGETIWEITKLLPARGCMIREAGTNYAQQRFDLSCLLPTEPPVFNLALHEHLLSLRFTYQRNEAFWEDVGDAENGPKLAGCPAFDLYEDATERFIVTETGFIYHEKRDLEMEKFLEAMEAEHSR